MSRPPRVRYLPVKYAGHCAGYPSFHRSGSVSGMRRKFYGRDALLVRCGQYVYNVSSQPALYDLAK